MSNARRFCLSLLLTTPSWSFNKQNFVRSTSLNTITALTMSTTTTTNYDSNNDGSGDKEYYRSDGVRIDFDPYAPGTAEKYGLEGGTDPEGFDPYADTVGPGIYGGGVRRDANGGVVIGEQYQNHNHRPGPVYDGGGYSLMSRAIHAGPETVRRILADHPALREEISTGGARPLHVCGMSRGGQTSVRVLLEAGADPRALDTYGYNALHRAASNDLEIGGRHLVELGGMDPNHKPPESDSSPMDIAKRSRAVKFLMAMEKLGYK